MSNSLINTICEEKGIRLECLSSDYILRLTKNGKSRQIFGAYWDINSAAADRIACDKTACALILTENKIPAVPHELLSTPPRRAEEEAAMWTRAAEFLAKNRRVVAKPNQGTMGRDIFLCETTDELEAAIRAVFSSNSDVALSPYREIENEYRVIFLDGACRLAYGKALGNSWQHNLSQGASAFEITDNRLLAQIQDLAARAANCIGITFASVDIAVSPNASPEVMEINSGVQVRHLLEQMPHLHAGVKEIFSDAIELLF